LIGEAGILAGRRRHDGVDLFRQLLERERVDPPPVVLKVEVARDHEQMRGIRIERGADREIELVFGRLDAFARGKAGTERERQNKRSAARHRAAERRGSPPTEQPRSAL
jgi:hypothetical protein